MQVEIKGIHVQPSTIKWEESSSHYGNSTRKLCIWRQKNIDTIVYNYYSIGSSKL